MLVEEFKFDNPTGISNQRIRIKCQKWTCKNGGGWSVSGETENQVKLMSLWLAYTPGYEWLTPVRE